MQSNIGGGGYEACVVIHLQFGIDRMCDCPQLAKRISPSMEIGPLSKPYLMVPCVAMAQAIQVSKPGTEPDISQPINDPKEDMTLAVPFLASSGVPSFMLSC